MVISDMDMCSSTRSAQAEEGQDGEDDHDEADEIDDTVHFLGRLCDALR